MRCPVCMAENLSSPLCKISGYDIYNCGRCAADYVSPMPGAEVLKKYYDNQAYYQGDDNGAYDDYDIQTALTLPVVEQLFDELSAKGKRSILDIGCGYGTHLASAAARGWECYGVEISDYGRAVAQQRLGSRAKIVERVAQLPRGKFDVITLFDVIEHLPSPYPLLYELFTLGAMAEHTTLVVTTPNAGSNDARIDPAKWRYRHPPSHLLYYSPETFEYLFKRLQFRNFKIKGQYPLYPWLRESIGLQAYGGLLATAQGSAITDFLKVNVHESNDVHEVMRCWEETAADDEIQVSPRAPIRLPSLCSRVQNTMYRLLRKIKRLIFGA